MSTFNIKDDIRYIVCTAEEPTKFVTFKYIDQTYYLGYDINLASKCENKTTAKKLIDDYKSSVKLKMIPIRVSYEVLDD